jgi:hypothetical protein
MLPLSLHPSAAMSYEEKSRMDLLRPAIRSFLINVRNNNPLHRVRLFFFNDKTQIVEGTTEELQERMDQVYPDNGTNMILCLQQMKQLYLSLSEQDQGRVICALLTDGMHNTTVKDESENEVTMEDVTSDSFYNNMFQSIIGIGHKDTVDYDVLTNLSGGRPDVFHLVSEEEEVFHAMNGTFFELLTSRYTDATISVWCINNDSVRTMGNVTRTYHTEKEFQERQQQQIETEQIETCSFMRLLHLNGTFLVGYDPIGSTQLEATVSGDPREFWFAVDTSGSMRSSVPSGQQKSFETVQVQPSDTHPYVELRMSVSTLSQNTNILGGGEVVAATITYKNKKSVMTEALMCQKAYEPNSVMRMGNIIVSLSSILSSQLTKEQVHDLYMEYLHLPFLLDIESIPDWMKAQGKVVWKNVKERYKSTLTVGEQFFFQTPIELGLMMRATSSDMSTQAATPFASSPEDVGYQSASNETSLCKLCYEQTISVLFPNCGHAGVCKTCYSTYLTTTGKHICPFCREDVSTWSEIRMNEKGCCQSDGCYQSCDYIGTKKDGKKKDSNDGESCGHLLYCKSCISKNKKEGGIWCRDCNEVVRKVVRIYTC